MSTAPGSRVTPDWRHPALCNWFANLFANELTKAQLAAYQQGEAEAVFSSLEELPELAEPVAQLRNAFNGLTLLEHPQLELAADFASMFLLDGASSAPPYASVYSSGESRFYAEPEERMRERLEASQQTLAEGFREPSDHLSVMLEYLADGLEAHINNEAKEFDQGPTLEQIQTFVDQELLSWLPVFTARCQKVNTVASVYPALAQLLLAFCTGLLTLEAEP